VVDLRSENQDSLQGKPRSSTRRTRFDCVSTVTPRVRGGEGPGDIGCNQATVNTVANGGFADFGPVGTIARPTGGQLDVGRGRHQGSARRRRRGPLGRQNGHASGSEPGRPPQTRYLLHGTTVRLPGRKHLLARAAKRARPGSTVPARVGHSDASTARADQRGLAWWWMWAGGAAAARHCSLTELAIAAVSELQHAADLCGRTDDAGRGGCWLALKPGPRPGRADSDCCTSTTRHLRLSGFDWVRVNGARTPRPGRIWLGPGRGSRWRSYPRARISPAGFRIELTRGTRTTRPVNGTVRSRHRWRIRRGRSGFTHA